MTLVATVHVWDLDVVCKRLKKTWRSKKMKSSNSDILSKISLIWYGPCNSKKGFTLFITSVTSMDQSLRWLAADETKHSCEVRMTEDGWSLKKSKGIKKKAIS